MASITGKSKLQASASLQAMLMLTIAAVAVVAAIFSAAAIEFNKVTLSFLSVFFQIMILMALLLNAIFLVRIEQKRNINR